MKKYIITIIITPAALLATESGIPIYPIKSSTAAATQAREVIEFKAVA